MPKVASRCIDCPRLTIASASRCRNCAQADQLKRNNARGGWDWPVIKAQVLDRDGRRCQDARPQSVRFPDCGGDLEVDHIIPLSEGGTNDLDNLITRCRRHHAEKTARERRKG